MREIRNAYKILIRKYEGKRPLGRPRHRWEDIIKLSLRISVLGCVLTLVNKSLNEPLDSMKGRRISGLAE
jgi:hypothetical protein